MDAAKVAREVKKMGFKVLKVEEADYQYDGTVTLTDNIHIQVPDRGNGVMVNRMDEEGLNHGKIVGLKDLKPEIDKAFADEAAAQTQATGA
jgi:hypothetical protein